MSDSDRIERERRTGVAVNDYAAMIHRNRITGVQGRRRDVAFDEFRQLVRRHRPSVLLPALAALTLGSGDPFNRPTDLANCPPWAVALAARESILWSNEHRKDVIAGDDLRVLFNAHNDLHDNDLTDASFSALGLLVRLAYEQFPYSESIYEEVSRSHAMLVEHAPGLTLEVLGDPDVWDRVLGMSLGAAVGATFFLQVAANQNAGWFDFAFLDHDDMPGVFERWPRETILRRLSDLSSTVEEFKAAYAVVPKPPEGLERYAYNPLTRRPFIRMPDGRYLAPQPRLILRTISPGSLYYTAIGELGDAFAHDLGHLVESYVGRQLRQLKDPAASSAEAAAPAEPARLGRIEVHPEVTYGRDKVLTIDWFVILPGVVILVEVKSARFGLVEKAGLDGFEKRSQALINKAIKQLCSTSGALERAQPELDHIPNDRPLIGLIVTGEPHYLANSLWMRDLVTQAPFPTLVASVREIEYLVTLDPEQVEQELVAITADPDRSTWSLGSALRSSESSARRQRNPLLDKAWASYPWLENPESSVSEERPRNDGDVN